MKSDRTIYREQRARALRARRFPHNTDGCSRHAFELAEDLADYPPPGDYMWMHKAASIMATVAMLWELRTEVEQDHSA